jgi:hypothetical protein
MRHAVKGLRMIIIGTISLERHGGSGSWLEVHMGFRFYHLSIVVEVLRGECVIVVE